MTQVPGIVHSVKVDDMDQGSIPLRIKSFRVLPSDDKAFLKGAVVQARKMPVRQRLKRRRFTMRRARTTKQM